MSARASTVRSVLIAGGGIAGIAAALRLAERAVRVTLLETRKKLGGRATSFTDVRSREVLDNCQHVVLGCCTNYLDLLARLGTLDQLTWTDQQWWFEVGGRTSIIRPGPLPAPGHFSLAMMGVRFLSWPEVSSLAKAMVSVMRADRAAWRARTFAEFLSWAGQSDRVIRRFWTPVIVSACNLDPARVCAASALHVFQEGFLSHRDAATIGVSRVPLVALYDRAEAALRAAGGQIRLGESVERVEPHAVVTGDGERLTADRVICALPVERAVDVLPEADPRREAMARFTHSPILGVHLTFDRPVLRTPHAVLVDPPGGVQWLFRKDEGGVGGGGGRAGAKVHAVISAADDWMPLTEEQIGARVLGDMHACLPDSRHARVLAVRAVKEKRATFAPTIEVEAARPPAVPPGSHTPGADHVILAGDYTDTGWPATMEGAARSGYTAAAHALGQAPSSMLAAPIKVALGARLLGLKSPA